MAPSGHEQTSDHEWRRQLRETKRTLQPLRTTRASNMWMVFAVSVLGALLVIAGTAFIMMIT